MTAAPNTVDVEIIKQYPGPRQFTRGVKGNVPGKDFPQLDAVEQRAFYEGTAVEFVERHQFQLRLQYNYV